ncbi:ethanolamine utilization protein EutH [Enterocloster lavalensis]|uniref:ethanolamine utilization protein EutH n=1 Tax=Enterocloster lavalensis TaxID=460384 RepID=UPI001D067450|nr:ethanolamine utilization protein EutH [Enterocloster lavalensis]MCB6346515.1 ethanolamine utilization protein EutH [Enterocloster lavalensis]
MLNFIIASGALIGALDCVFGNRLKLGDKFQEGFLCMGPTAFSMVGIICLAPLLGRICGAAVAPAFRAFGIDPAMFGCILANNMGGYPLAITMADGRELGLYSGLIVSSTLGATIVYTIPVALGLIPRKNQDDFAMGVMIGLVTIPIGSAAGGLAMGLEPGVLLRNTVPVALISALVIAGFLILKSRVVRGFMYFAAFLRVITILSLGAAAFGYIAHVPLVKGLDPIEEALAVVADMCVVQLGSIPLAYLFIDLMKRPLAAAGRLLRINDVAVAAFPISCVNVMSVFMLVKDMDRRGIVLSAAWYTNTICILTAHYAYTQSMDPSMVGPMMAAKLTGGVLAVVLACFMTKNMKERE